jgi:alpha-ketoglutarate-dependent 2,4-dichlorophenoxyacetate dioxygenase
MEMAMRLSPIEQGFGMIASEVSLRGSSLAETVREIASALDEHLLLLFRDTGLSLDDYVAFGQHLGPLENFGKALVAGAGWSIALSNLNPDGTIFAADSPWRRNIAGDALWHTDHTYMPRRARYSMLLAETVPSWGGETQYCDTRGAYDALPGETKERLEGLVAVHSLIYSRSLAGFTDWTAEQRAQMPPIPQPLVFRNPKTGRKSLYLASHIGEILGMPSEDARQLASDLIAFAAQPPRVYSHKWRPGDVVIWDDRATMHRRAPYDDLNEPRKLHTMRVIEPSDLYDPAVELQIH